MSKTLILDNGAHELKANYAGVGEPRRIPNCIVKSKADRKRVFAGSEMDELQDKSALFFSLPFEKGYLGARDISCSQPQPFGLVNWNVELEVWDRLFGRSGLDVDFQDCRLVQTDPSSLVPAIPDISDEVAFEIYQFEAYAQTSGT